MNDSHVYVDYKPNGIPFYVGKGTSARVRKLERGNRWHTNICNKYPEWRRVVVETATDELCREFEEFLIAEIGRADLHLGPLVNFTDGGDGHTNPSPDVRKRLSDSKKAWAASEEGFATNSRSARLRMSSELLRRRVRESNLKTWEDVNLRKKQSEDICARIWVNDGQE